MAEKKLFYGDNLDVLRKYIKDETIDLCYIDPPFNSKRNYNQIYNNIGTEDQAQAQAFIDTWTWDNAAELGLNEISSNHGNVFTRQSIELILGLERVLGKGALLSYLVSMTLRIAEIYRVLKLTGSFYLHCDSAASHYLKLISDALFCGQKGIFQNEIIWKRTSAHNDPNRFGRNSDRILFYTKTPSFNFYPVYLAYDESYLKNFYRHEDNQGRFMLDNLTGPKINPNDKEWRGYHPSKVGRSWSIPREAIKSLAGDSLAKKMTSTEKLDLLYENGLIEISKNGTPRFKRYLDKMEGAPAQEIWVDIPPISAHSKESLGYPTQKPEALLERIIRASSSKGDLVLDAYCGCGTTIAVAQRLERQWVGIDITYHSVSLMLKRLEDSFGNKVLEKIELNGIPKDFASAEQLANKKEDKVRKEFEKWAVLTFSNNRAVINEKKGGDAGIDGIAYLLDADEKNKQIHKSCIFSVKSNKTLSPMVIRDLNGTIEREKAACGFLITLYSMDNLIKESKKYGMYQNNLFNHSYPKIEVITAEDILNGMRMKLPTSIDVVKKASRKKERNTQISFDGKESTQH